MFYVMILGMSIFLVLAFTFVIQERWGLMLLANLGLYLVFLLAGVVRADA